MELNQRKPFIFTEDNLDGVDGPIDEEQQQQLINQFFEQDHINNHYFKIVLTLIYFIFFIFFLTEFGLTIQPFFQIINGLASIYFLFSQTTLIDSRSETNQKFLISNYLWFGVLSYQKYYAVSLLSALPGLLVLLLNGWGKGQALDWLKVALYFVPFLQTGLVVIAVNSINSVHIDIKNLSEAKYILKGA